MPKVNISSDPAPKKLSSQQVAAENNELQELPSGGQGRFDAVAAEAVKSASENKPEAPQAPIESAQRQPEQPAQNRGQEQKAQPVSQDREALEQNKPATQQQVRQPVSQPSSVSSVATRPADVAAEAGLSMFTEDSDAQQVLSAVLVDAGVDEGSSMGERNEGFDSSMLDVPSMNDTDAQFSNVDNGKTEKRKDDDGIHEASEERASDRDYVRPPSSRNFEVSDPKMRPMSQSFNVSSERPRSLVSRIRKAYKEILGRSYEYGNNLGGEAISNADLSLSDAEVGTNILFSAMEQPSSKVPEKLSKLLEKQAGYVISPQELVEIAQIRDAESVAEVIDAVNRSNIVVYIKKNPTVGFGSQRQAVLRLRSGDGIAVHPLSALMMNADHDGDVLIVSLEMALANKVPHPMELLIDRAGNAMIDSEFFLIHQRFDRDRVRDDVWNVMSRFGGVSRSMSDKLADLMFKIPTARTKEEKKQKWSQFLRTIRNVSQTTAPNTVNLRTDNILKALYDWNNESYRDELSRDASSLPNAFVPEVKEIIVQSVGDEMVSDMMDGVAKREIPLNYQEIKIFFANYLGFEKDKNLDFRITANFGKLINLDDRMLVGSEYEIKDEKSLYELINKSADYVYAKMMANRSDSGEYRQFASAYAQFKVIGIEIANVRNSDLGKLFVPSNYRTEDGSIDIKSFEKELTKRTDDVFHDLDSADVEITTDFSNINRSTKHRGAIDRHRATGSWAAFARNLNKVYGDMTLGTLFGSDPMFDQAFPGCRNVKLKDYVRNMGGSIGSPTGGISYMVSEAKKADLRDVAAAISDLRRKDSAEFDRSLRSASRNAMERIAEMREIMRSWKSEPTRRNYKSFVEFTMNQLTMMQPDVFFHYKLDTPDAWVNTDRGRYLLSSKDMYQFMSRMYEMIVGYRIERVSKARNLWASAVATDSEVGPSVENMHSMYDRELEALASSSPLWKLIAADMNTNGGVYQDLKNKIDGRKKDKNGLMRVGRTIVDSTIWDSREYKSIMDIIKDDSIPWSSVLEGRDRISRDTKEDLLCDLLKLYTGKNYIPSEMGWMLMQDPSSVYSGNPFVNDTGYSSVTENIKSSSDSLGNNTKETYDRIVKDVQDGIAAYGETGVQKLAQRISKDMGEVLGIDPGMFADALNTAMDKTSADTEKNSQQEAMTAFVSALNVMRSGGLWSDLAVCDDFMNGRISADRLKENPFLIVFVLCNRSVELTVYDSNGEYPMSYDSLVGDGTLSDWLLMHPRIAMCFRKHTASAGKKGKVYAAANKSFKETLADAVKPDNGTMAAYNALIDHPGFGALVFAASGTRGMTSRGKRNEVIDGSLKNLVENFIRLSKKDDGQIEKFVENDIVFGERPEGVDQDVYNEKVKRMKEHIKEYAKELRRMKWLRSSGSSTPHMTFYLNDKETLSGIEDVEQMLSGGKTSVMTEINGAETTRNGLFPFYAAEINPPCGTSPDGIPVDEFLEDFEKYIGVKTEFGVPVTPENIDEIVEASGDMVMLYIPCNCSASGHPCVNHSVHDASTDNVDAEQFTAMSLLMTINRMDSTEKNLLKFKKVGIDKSDSVTKFSVFDMLKRTDSGNWSEAVMKGKIEEAYKKGGLPAARREYASIMRENHSKLGYNDLTEMQYQNIAMMLLFEREGGLQVLTASQLSNIINGNLDAEAASRCESVFELRKMMDAAVESYSSEKLDIEELMAGVKVANQSKYRAAIRSRSSSFERNLSTIKRIHGELGEEVPALTREQISGIAYTAASRNIDLVKKFPYAFDITYNPDTKKSKVGSYDPHSGYDLLAVVSKKNQVAQINRPSPANLWIIDVEDFKDNESGLLGYLDTAYRYAVNVAITNEGWEILGSMESAKMYFENAVIADGDFGKGTRIIPMFDMKANGINDSAIHPDDSFNVGVHKYNPDRIMRIAEDIINEFKLGDAMVKMTKYTAGRIRAKKSGMWRMSVSTMFKDVLEENDGSYQSVRLLSKPEIERRIVNGTMGHPIDSVEDIDLASLSLRVSKDSKMYQEMLNEFKMAWFKFATNFESSCGQDEGKFLNARPGDIVWFAEISYINKNTGQNETRIAPIMPFRTREPKGSPSDFNADIYVNSLTSDIEIAWSHESSMLGRVFKLFEGRNSANKGMVDGNSPADGERLLRHGIPVDFYMARESTASRRMSNIRVDTMYTMMVEARTDEMGYNIADCDWALPLAGDQDFKNRLRQGKVPFWEWQMRLGVFGEKTDITFVSGNDVLNRFINNQCRRAISIGVNPTVWLTSYLVNENKQIVPHHLGFRYDAMFENNRAYQENLQLLMSMMCKNLCPPTVGGDYTNTLFRNNPNNNSLEMQVPHYSTDGTLFYQWENVFSSFCFMDQHYSGFHKPSIKGKRYSMQSLLFLGYGGEDMPNGVLGNLVKSMLADKTEELASGWSMYLDPNDLDND